MLSSAIWNTKMSLLIQWHASASLTGNRYSEYSPTNLSRAIHGIATQVRITGIQITCLLCHQLCASNTPPERHIWPPYQNVRIWPTQKNNRYFYYSNSYNSLLKSVSFIVYNWHFEHSHPFSIPSFRSPLFPRGASTWNKVCSGIKFFIPHWPYFSILITIPYIRIYWHNSIFFAPGQSGHIIYPQRQPQRATKWLAPTAVTGAGSVKIVNRMNNCVITQLISVKSSLIILQSG
jgi:hypothetical protein